MSWQLRFLGVGAAHAVALGTSAAVLERDGKPLLLIDCGPGTLDRYLSAYGEPPSALYITHTHLDHVGDMEQLFARLWFDPQRRGRTRVFAHAAMVPWLHARVGDYPGVLAEGGVNFWQAFQLLPCTTTCRVPRMDSPCVAAWSTPAIPAPYRKCSPNTGFTANWLPTTARWSATLRTPGWRTWRANIPTSCAHDCCCITTAARKMAPHSLAPGIAWPGRGIASTCRSPRRRGRTLADLAHSLADIDACGYPSASLPGQCAGTDKVQDEPNNPAFARREVHAERCPSG